MIHLTQFQRFATHLPSRSLRFGDYSGGQCQGSPQRRYEKKTQRDKCYAPVGVRERRLRAGRPYRESFTGLALDNASTNSTMRTGLAM